MENNRIRGPDRRELRARSEGFTVRDISGKQVLEGYFAVFNSDYEIWDGMTESIAPGAFADTISGDIRALCNHDSRIVLGRTKSGTLSLIEDSRGLWGSVILNEADSDAINVYERVRRGDVDGCSIGFEILQETHSVSPDGGDHWTIERVKLFEVSVCTFPAYAETSVAARCRDRDAVRERVEAWRDEMKRRLKDGT